MKKIAGFSLLLLVMALVGSCTAQDSSSYAQKFVGTWSTEEDGKPFTVVFAADGTVTAEGEKESWGVSHSGEFFMGEEVVPIFFSPDGKRMIVGNNKYKMVLHKK